MKLNSREKVLLILLAMVGFLAAYYYLLLSPQLERLAEIKTAEATFRQQVETMKANMKPDHPIYNELQTKSEELAKRTERLYPTIIQEKLITVLDEKFKAVGVNPNSVSFAISQLAAPAQQGGQTEAQPQVDLIALRQNYTALSEEAQQAEEEVNFNDNFRQNEMIVGFSIKTEYQKLMALVSEFEKDKYKVVVNNLSMSTGETSEVTASLTISFISVPKLFEDGDKEYLDWKLAYNSNKSNPFSLSANLGAGEKAPEPVVTPVPVVEPPKTEPPKPAEPPKPTTTAPAPSKNSDFAITLRPISSDIPTVLVGKVNDKGSQAYVYADNPDMEDVEVQVIEQDGKLYYRYKTTEGSYPSNYSDMTEFTPKTTNIIVEVISTKRTGADDKSGINLTVINKTSKKVSVVIKNDDSSRSRVKIKSTSGNVGVSR